VTYRVHAADTVTLEEQGFRMLDTTSLEEALAGR
jgi:hypothetical protein